jgi:CRP/FNR family cyclic AMP-dependent transcriptional regulator
MPANDRPIGINRERHGSLAGVAILAELDAASRAAIERDCAWRRWPRGGAILDREGTTSDVYFVVSGRARVVDLYDAGQRFVIFDEIAAGGCFGELAAIDRQPRSAYIVAAEETVTATLGADAFIDLLFRHPNAGMGFLRRLTEMVRQSDLRIMDVSTLSARDRVCLELLRRAKVGGGRPVNTAAIQPPPNHGDMAARVSTTRETVSRILGELSRQGLLRRDDEVLVLTDLGRLITLAHKNRE